MTVQREQPESAAAGAVSKDEEMMHLVTTPQPGLARELWDFLRANKKWWLLPILLTLLVLGSLVMLSGTAVAPFVYTLF